MSSPVKQIPTSYNEQQKYASQLRMKASGNGKEESKIENKEPPQPVRTEHLTQDMAPDRRFKENRDLSDKDAEIERAKRVLDLNGIKHE